MLNSVIKPYKSRTGELLLNYLAAMSFISLFFYIYTEHALFSKPIDKKLVFIGFSINGKELLQYVVLFYSFILIPYYLTLEKNYKTKSVSAWSGLIFFIKGKSLTERQKIAARAILVKGFFLPLMLVWLAIHFGSIYGNLTKFIENGDFFPYGYWFAFYLILFADVFFFTIGYAVEHPWLRNEIKSVDPSMLGWFVALICYPPFNGMTNDILGWYSKDYPAIENVYLQYFSGGLILVLMFFYAWASVALNLKASNLTNRGIVTFGPYGWVRHPAYAAKNLAWWVGSVPILAIKLDEGMEVFFYGVASMLLWSYIYYLRSTTEERHLLMDAKYKDYCEKVRFRFIPGFY